VAEAADVVEFVDVVAAAGGVAGAAGWSDGGSTTKGWQKNATRLGPATVIVSDSLALVDTAAPPRLKGPNITPLLVNWPASDADHDPVRTRFCTNTMATGIAHVWSALEVGLIAVPRD
jgi:hypothetical protein